MRCPLLVLIGMVLLPSSGAAQRDGRCLLQVLNVDRQGVGFQPSPGVQNYYAGGNVRMRCVGQEVRMWSDSVASYQGQVIQFIGKVRYRDSTVEMTADFGTYFRDTDRWEARGSVILTNRANGSVLRGPTLDYLRPAAGVRDTSEMFADLRPTITLPARDSLQQAGEPYVIVGDRIRVRGDTRIYAGGRVTIDRTDLEARGDTLFLDTGAGSRGTLMGTASVRRTAADSFDLKGRQIDLTLEGREVTYVLARGESHLRATELDLLADTIGVDVNARKVEQIVAWGDSLRPAAQSSEGFEVRGDSVAFDTPGQRLTEARAFGNGWMGAKPDSIGGERDFVAGDTVTVSFRADADSTGAPRTLLDSLQARGNALALYRLLQPPPNDGGRLAIVYTRAASILITMKIGTDGQSTVDQVRSIGDVDGIHLQPTAIVADTSATVRPRRPPGPPR
ncbi:MAG: hypothetical protein SGI84_05415 [Gemmatimonadota bacterium]|nr:hypothetical protein [Gemmatimonadota bacterium]